MALAAGTALGPYEIVGLIGAGGMGEVYRAKDARLQRTVAIKILPASFSTEPTRLRRFEHEARAAGSLNHPNIVAVYDVGAHDACPYIVTEFLEGQTLRDKLVSQLSVERATDYATQIATGLAAAHAQGILHRDLKPENVFVTKDGRAKILDFGLAKSTGSTVDEGATLPSTQNDISAPGTVLGTVGYMSPEQVLGKPVDARSDIFSFGAVLYEMLAGRRAFPHESAVDTMYAILHQELPDTTGLTSRVPRPLLSILRRCLAKAPDERFQSASDLAFALSTLSNHQVEPIVPGIVKHPAARHWLEVGLAGLSIAAVCATAGYWAGGRRDNGAPPSFRQLTFRRGTVTTARFAYDGQTVIYAGRWDGKPRQLFSLRLDTTESTALPLPEADILSVSKSSELAILKADGTLARVPLGGGGARDVADNVLAGDWAPDGTTLALVRHEGARQWLEYPIGTTIFRPIDVFNTLRSPRVSPDGEFVAVVESAFGSGRITIVDRSGVVKCRSRNTNIDEGAAWTPDGREVWFNRSETGLNFAVHAVALDGRERLVYRSMGVVGISDIARDGRALMVHQGVRAVMTGIGPDETSERDLTWLDFSRPQDLSSDGRVVLFTESGTGAGANPAAFVRPTDGSPAVLLGAGLRAWALSPDGKWALATKADQSADEPQLKVVLLPIGAGQARVLESSTLTSFTRGRWLPDGTRVMFNARDAGRPPRDYVQNIVSGAPMPITPEGVSSEGGVTPDSRFVLASGEGGSFWMYPINGGSPFPAKGLSAGDLPIRWSGDGTMMWTVNQEHEVPEILRINVSTGRRESWRKIRSADPAGLDPASLRVVISADGRSYVFSYFRLLSDLYVAGGLH
jgi:Tol biopolymer transport system component